ncbi:MAG: hypothetical protein C4297_04975 [Gemmataceae bacterium]
MLGHSTGPRARCGALVSLGIVWGLLVGESVGHAQDAVDSSPLRLFAEAEDFTVQTGDWKPLEWGTNYFADTLAITFLSRQRYLGAPEQGVPSVAYYDLPIPRDGSCDVWVRYEQPYDFSVEFDLEIQQDGKSLATIPFGRKAAPKLWPFRRGFVPMVLWDWGANDNIVWEKAPAAVALKRGVARLILRKGPQADKKAARRNVDVVLLTDDRAGVERQLKHAQYLPLDGWLTQAGQVYVQVHNPPDAPAPLVLKTGPCTQHSPYWVHVRDWPTQVWIGREETSKPPEPKQYLQPGERSPWVEVGKLFDTFNQFQWKVQTFVGGRAQGGTRVRITFKLADALGGKVLRDDLFQANPAGDIDFFLDADLKRTQRIRTVDEDLESLLAYIRSLPKRGRRPERFRIYGIMGASTALQLPGRTGQLAREIAVALGSNTLPEIAKPELNDAIDVRHVATKDLRAYLEKLRDQGALKRVKVVSLGDEIHIHGTAKSPDDDPAFRKFLAQKGLRPRDLDLNSLDDATVTLQDRNSKLYYYSHMFAFERELERIKERTDIIESILPKGATVGANYSPHPHYWPKEGQWVRAFRRRAMTLPWGEDYVWQVPEVSPQVIGYLLAAFRCGAREHRLPIHWYVMPHAPGNTPDNFRRAYYTAIAHGARQLNFFCATPLSVAYTENYVSSEARDMWRAIHQVVHETGLFEHVVYEADPRPAAVGLLISYAQDLWDTAPAYNHERKCLYLLLRQSGFAVDFVTEEDIQRGHIKHLSTIYIVGNHLERATAQALKDWVRQGGVIAGIAGGGFLDEHNRPLDVLHEVYGIKNQAVDRRHPFILSKQNLYWLEPFDTITTRETKRAYPAIGFKQTYDTLPQTTVLATFGDGSPAVLWNEYGKGMAFLYGSFLASAYIRQGLLPKPVERSPRPDSYNHFLPTDFDGQLADLVTAPVGAGSVRYDVITNEPLVEATVLEGRDALAVVLVNWTPAPKKVDLTVQYVPQGLTKVTSIQHGPLDATRIGVTVSFKLQVDVADVVLIEK